MERTFPKKNYITSQTQTQFWSALLPANVIEMLNLGETRLKMYLESPANFLKAKDKEQAQRCMYVHSS